MTLTQQAGGILFLRLQPIEIHHRQASRLCGNLGHKISGEMMPRRMTDMEILIFVSETHRAGATAVFPPPGVEVTVLQQIVAHLPFIPYEYHARLLFSVAKINILCYLRVFRFKFPSAVSTHLRRHHRCLLQVADVENRRLLTEAFDARRIPDLLP